jgi:hypothetical protein
MKRISLFIVLLLLSILAQSQTNGQFKPGGKPFMRIFNNFHTYFSDDESASAFELTRLYLGYEYTINENFTALATIDIANPDAGNLEMTAFAKNAYLNYHPGKLSVFFGIIPTTQFKAQEDFWGYRYIEKSFQDAYRFNASADLGISASYGITDFLSADVIVANGEGYKKLESDSVLRAGIGITLKPAKKFLSRIYYDFSHRDATLSSLAFFTGYANERFSLAAEYNKQMNYDFRKGADLLGTSVYGTLQATKKIRVLARYDKLMSNKVPGTSEDWNLANDGELFMAGVEFPVVKGIRFSPNLRGWNPAGPGESFRSSIYFNLEIKL